jgi:hypothetical protein
MEALLDEFEPLFTMPYGLPPARAHNAFSSCQVWCP